MNIPEELEMINVNFSGYPLVWYEINLRVSLFTYKILHFL